MTKAADISSDRRDGNLGYIYLSFSFLCFAIVRWEWEAVYLVNQSIRSTDSMRVGGERRLPLVVENGGTLLQRGGVYPCQEMLDVLFVTTR